MAAGTLTFRAACVAVVAFCAALLYGLFMQPVAVTFGPGICKEEPLPDWCVEMLTITPPPCRDLRVECWLRRK